MDLKDTIEIFRSREPQFLSTEKMNAVLNYADTFEFIEGGRIEASLNQFRIQIVHGITGYDPLDRTFWTSHQV